MSRLTQLAESLKQEVDAAVAAARRPRERATGRYGFVNRWERLCQCGHKLGDHTAQAPHDCIAVDFGHGPCGCERFRPEKKKPATKAEGRIGPGEFEYVFRCGPYSCTFVANARGKILDWPQSDACVSCGKDLNSPRTTFTTKTMRLVCGCGASYRVEE